MADLEEYVCSPDYAYEAFKGEILRLTGINLHAYKEKQMKRRIITLIKRKGFDGYEDYVRILEINPKELEFFVGYITINVTEFFRTKDHWTYFEENTLKELAQREGRLNIWSTACSTGEEPYSLVMSLARYLPLDRIRVMATDIDQKVLEQAKRGIFSAKAMETVPDDLKQNYFSGSKDGWQIAEKVRNCVDFLQMDLLKDPFPNEQDLILCRNVLIYFTEEAKNQIYENFYNSLAEGGYLFTGNTEQIIQYKKFGYIKERNFLYQK